MQLELLIIGFVFSGFPLAVLFMTWLINWIERWYFEHIRPVGSELSEPLTGQGLTTPRQRVPSPPPASP